MRYVLSRSEENASKKNLSAVTVKIEGSDEVIFIPLQAISMLKSILSNMAEGKPVTLLPLEAELSPQEAAAMLHVPSSFVIELIEKGKIPHQTTEGSPKILFRDALTYESQLRSKRRENLNKLASEAQALKLGY
ncbi:MAG: excisionase [Bacteroidota bacterium]